MPELPEVEVVRRGLAEHATGRVIGRAELFGHRVARRHDAGPADLTARLAGARIEAADRRGKYLWLVVRQPGDDPRALVIHLGMSGQILVAAPESPVPRHLRARFVLGGTELRFVDQRTFGGIALDELVPDPHARPGAAPGAAAAAGPGQHRDGVPAAVAHIAPDPLEAAFDQAAVVRRMRARRSGIKRCLLDQSLVSGIGNIYADESLWRAGIHGEHPAMLLEEAACARVLASAAEVMTEALAQGGTSFDALYVHVNGQSGYFDRSLAVYGQAGQPCHRCGTAVVRESFMNRGSHFCPSCQRLR